MPPRTRAPYLGDLAEYRNETVGTGPDTVAAGDDPRFTASGFLATQYGTPGANDLAMIQAAIDAAAPFGAWVLINGARPISGTLNVPSGSRIDMSQGSITQNANLTPTFKLNNVNNVRFRNVKIVGKGTDHQNNSGVYAACGIWLAGTTTTDVHIDGGEITGVTGAGIYVSDNLSGFRIRNVKIVGPGEPAITPVTTNYGACIAMSTASDFEVTGCDLSLHGQGVVTGEINDFRISHNYIHDITGQHGLYLEPGARFAIVGNVIKNTCLQGIKLQIPISSSPDADMGTIAGNSVTAAGSHCILLTQIPGNTPRLRRITISGNTLSSVGVGGGDGIAMFYVAGITITGNSIYNVQNGIRATTGTGLTIGLNRVNTAQLSGVAFTDITDSELVNNRIIDPGALDNGSAEYGIQIAGASSGIKVDGNTVSDSTGHMRYGLFLSMTGSGQASCVVRNNDFSGATDYGARCDNTQSIKEWANNVCAGTLGEILNFPTGLIIKGSTKGRYIGTAAPTTGTYRQGDRVDNSTPVTGGPIGWVCVAAGTPGTWAPVGGEWIDVKTFGAKGDGLTDDTAAIQAAFNALPVAAGNEIGGGCIFFPKGVYLVNTVTSGVILRLADKANVTLMGVGSGGSRIRTSTATADELLRIQTCTNFQMRDIMVQVIATARVGRALHYTTGSPGSTHFGRFSNVTVSCNGSFRNAYDVSCAIGSPTIYSALAQFAAGDVGGFIMVNLSDGPFTSTIQSVATLTGTLAANINSSVTTITLNSAIPGAPASGFTIKVGNERMFVSAGGNTTTLTVTRGRGPDVFAEAHTAGDAVTTYSATLADNAPATVSNSIAPARIQPAGSAVMENGFCIGTDHPGASNLDIANTQVNGLTVIRGAVAGVRVGNGTSGNNLDHWAYGLNVHESGYGVFLHAGSFDIRSGDFDNNLVDIRRYAVCSSELIIDGIRSESPSSFYEYTGSATSGSSTVLSAIEVVTSSGEGGVPLTHLNSGSLTINGMNVTGSPTVAGNLLFVIAGTAASPCHLIANNVQHSGGSGDLFASVGTGTPATRTCIKTINNQSRRAPNGVVALNTVVGNYEGNHTMFGGGFGRARTAVADTNYNIVRMDSLVAFTSLTAARVANLPAQGNTLPVGQEFTIVDESGACDGTKTITITPPSGTINGAASYVLNTAYARVTIYTNGTNWFIRSA